MKDVTKPGVYSEGKSHVNTHFLEAEIIAAVMAVIRFVFPATEGWAENIQEAGGSVQDEGLRE
jgi:hypothetical protein